MTPHLEKPSGALGNLMLGTVGLLAHLSASRRLLPIRLSIIALACNCRRTGAIVLARMATHALLVATSASLWEANAQRAMWTLWLETHS